jgi:hypothetical protein
LEHTVTNLRAGDGRRHASTLLKPLATASVAEKVRPQMASAVFGAIIEVRDVVLAQTVAQRWLQAGACTGRRSSVPRPQWEGQQRMSVTEQYLANNRAYASRFTGPLPMEPSEHVAVVTCMDARLNIYAALGLKEGEANVIRNAGGVITDDVTRSLAVSQQLLGTNEIILIHGC